MFEMAVYKEKKTTFISRFHTSFNAAYDSLLAKYKKQVVFFIQKKWLSFGIVAGCIAVLVFLMQVTPTGMVPNEDTGTIMGAVTLPPGTSQERTYEVMNKVDSLVSYGNLRRSFPRTGRFYKRCLDTGNWG